jgi:hypothetical protein
MHQADYWLCLLLLALSLVLLITRLTLPIKWSWGFIIQALPIIALATTGLYFEPKWVYALSGWILVIVFFLPPKLFYSAMQRNLTDLNAEGMRKIAGYVHFFFWGMAGEFWRDMCLAMAFYIEQKGDEGGELVNKWIGKEYLPKQVCGFLKIGNAIMWRWQPIIDVFEKLPEKDQKKLSYTILIPTARAYAECGRFGDAARCIEISKLGETMVPINYLALSLLPFFSMTGAYVVSAKKVYCRYHSDCRYGHGSHR